jgi:hypothetical protein
MWISLNPVSILTLSGDTLTYSGVGPRKHQVPFVLDDDPTVSDVVETEP